MTAYFWSQIYVIDGTSVGVSTISTTMGIVRIRWKVPLTVAFAIATIVVAVKSKLALVTAFEAHLSYVPGADVINKTHVGFRFWC